jgi:hypothetical protein
MPSMPSADLVRMAKRPPTLANYLRALPVCVAAALLGSAIAGLAISRVVFGVVFGLFLGFGAWFTAIAISRWAWRRDGKT